MSFQVGDTVGTYRIIKRLGGGGMGEVYQVEHTVTGRMEAMKVVATDASETSEQDQRFLREIQLQAELDHPNIAAVHNAFRENGHFVMIMELVEGGSLRSILEHERLPLAVSIKYACQALEALEYAHAHGIVHRDISPGNIIVTETETLKLTDFGLAKSQRSIRLTETGVLLGSLYYAPPEQVKGSSAFDTRSDIYSLGAVLYEMTTGRKLFYSENPYTVMMAHVEQMPERPSEVRPGLPPALDEILLKALEKDPDERFQSAALFRQALESVDSGGNVARLVSAASGRRWPRALKVAAVVLMGVLSGWTSKVGQISSVEPAALSDALGIVPEADRNAGGGSDATTPHATAAVPPAPESKFEPPLPQNEVAHAAGHSTAQKTRNVLRRTFGWIAHPFRRHNDIHTDARLTTDE
jgi:serine/threonine-protein kinase